MNVVAKENQQTRKIPFDTALLDRLMDEAGIDVLLVTSKHNVQYLLGGHRAFFFDYMDAFGTSRYLPVLVYPKGAPEKAAYIGHGMESYQHQMKPLWMPDFVRRSASARSTRWKKAARTIKKTGVKANKIGVEFRVSAARRSECAARRLPNATLSMRCFRWSVCGPQDPG